MLKFEDFTPRQMRDLSSVLGVLKKKVRDRRLPRDFGSLLADILARTGEQVCVTFRGNEGSCGVKTKPGQETKSFTLGSNQIFICQKAFTAKHDGKPRLGAILLHELVHTRGGLELDAETFENLLFRGEGARPPDRRDYARFREQDSPGAGRRGAGIQGTWVLMNPRTKEVTDKKIGRHVIHFRPRRRDR
ncbi:MAG: hypothetical protein HY713_13445 [candidate division NC10 bacterium]|nr:hypothetical protein [candidate division NC10 bacterium]